MDLNLEDFSADELQEFMQTEQYEQLDELSKKTLGSYINKASADANSSASDAGGNFANAHTAKLHGMAGGEKELNKASTNMNKVSKRQAGISKAVSKLTKEGLDENLDHNHIQQTLAGKDINSKIHQGKVQVHKSNLAKAKAHVAKLGHKIEVVSGLNEELAESKSHYDAGSMASLKGKKYSDNPHPKDSTEHLDWSKGHNAMRSKTANEDLNLEDIIRESIDSMINAIRAGKTSDAISTFEDLAAVKSMETLELMKSAMRQKICNDYVSGEKPESDDSDD